MLEFLVSILSGAQYLQDISQAAHPLDKDHAVAEAWGQPDWADYSGVSRTLSGLSWEEARQVAKLLEEISQGYVNAELQELQSTGQRIQYDGDLTGLPVSNTSQSYPNAAFGHMDDTICLGYQAALLSLAAHAMVVYGYPARIIRAIPLLVRRRSLCCWPPKPERVSARYDVPIY